MISKQKAKWIQSLKQKKYREREGLFVVEGTKLVSELLDLLSCRYLAVSEHSHLSGCLRGKATELVETTDAELRRVSFQTSPQGVLGVFEIPQFTFSIEEITGKLNLFLDDIQDPGNLGTIIRLADWFGIENIFCSIGTVDAYNPKVVQATMGAIARVKVYYVEKVCFFQQIVGEIPIYGAYMNGDNLYGTTLSKQGIIVMGNEGNGISKEVEPFVSQRVSIPSFSTHITTSESLNVAVATAVDVAEFRRKGELD